MFIRSLDSRTCVLALGIEEDENESETGGNEIKFRLFGFRFLGSIKGSHS